jgi:hypothetical protein
MAIPAHHVKVTLLACVAAKAPRPELAAAPAVPGSKPPVLGTRRHAIPTEPTRIDPFQAWTEHSAGDGRGYGPSVGRIGRDGSATRMNQAPYRPTRLPKTPTAAPTRHSPRGCRPGSKTSQPMMTSNVSIASSAHTPMYRGIGLTASSGSAAGDRVPQCGHHRTYSIRIVSAHPATYRTVRAMKRIARMVSTAR